MWRPPSALLVAMLLLACASPLSGLAQQTRTATPQLATDGRPRWLPQTAGHFVPAGERFVISTPWRVRSDQWASEGDHEVAITVLETIRDWHQQVEPLLDFKEKENLRVDLGSNELVAVKLRLEHVTAKKPNEVWNPVAFVSARYCPKLLDPLKLLGDCHDYLGWLSDHGQGQIAKLPGNALSSGFGGLGLIEGRIVDGWVGAYVPSGAELVFKTDTHPDTPVYFAVE